MSWVGPGILRPWRVASLAVALACKPSPEVPCRVHTNPEMRLGYEIMWTRNADFGVFDRICFHRTKGTDSLVRFEMALVRGTGDVHVGSGLWSELAPRLAEFKIDGWGLSCGGHVYAITINSKQESCRVDRIIEAIGQYLKQRNASDFVVLQMGLWDAPAL